MQFLSADIVVIGAGIAGASVAAHLAAARRIVLIEMEDRPGYHTTGRSAAVFEPNYGPAAIRSLTRAAREFYHSPPAGFAAGPLVNPRESMFLMPAGQEKAAEQLLAVSQQIDPISFGEALKRCPLLRESYPKTCYLDRSTADIDVDLLHQGYLRLFKARGGELICSAEATVISRDKGRWAVTTPRGTVTTSILVNAAGAWADKIASLADVAPMHLVPKRRSIAVIAPPAGQDVMAWPHVADTGETWYCKPSGGRLLVSSAEATPVEPHDAYADDMALAAGIERFQQAYDIEVTHIETTWGGLRTFAPDGEPVCGYDAKVEGFFWLAGQGGYGIQTAPALSRLAAALIEQRAIPADIAAEGLSESQLAPSRFGG